MPNSNTKTSSDSDDKFRLVVEFSTDNAAFEDDPESEINDTLRGVMLKVMHHCETFGGIQDSNGNTIGRWYVGDDPATTETTGE